MARGAASALGLRRLALLCPLAATCASAEPEFTRLIKGISYGPVPLKSTHGGSELPQDDWMAPAAKPMWGPRGRGDLRIIKALGANMVRLYGNNPDNDHTGFLNEAFTNGLKVAPGLSDWPYYQNPNRTMPERPCKYTDYNCYEQILFLYEKNLRNGFLTADGRYHPALAYMNIINEPDLKMPSTTDIGGPEGPREMSRVIISAFDAMLDAEKKMGMRGPGINFTATFSYAVCMPCETFNRHPALGQIAHLEDAMKHPEKYGYVPKNDIAEAYRTRWTHSFNTANKASDLPGQFLRIYEHEFPTTPVYIGEYHHPHINQTEDMLTVLGLARASSVFLGVSFFQFQQAYWKGGTEMAFGMFGLGATSLAPMSYFGKDYDVYCLETRQSARTGTTLSRAVATAYGGPYLDTKELCLESPDAAALDANGFARITRQGKASRMATFVTRVLQHLGGFPVDAKALERFAGQFVGVPQSAFGSMVGFLVQRPKWTYFDIAARCVADRNANAGEVGAAIGYVCSNETLQRLGGFNCSKAPEACEADVFSLGDWVFSNYYQTLRAPNPLVDCSFQGAAMYASTAYWAQWSPECVVGPQAALPKVVPAVPFTPLNIRSYVLEAREAEGGGSTLQAGGPLLGSAMSPGLAVAQASGHGAPGRWWAWLLLLVTALGGIGCAAHNFISKTRRSKGKKAKARKARAAKLAQKGGMTNLQEAAPGFAPRAPPSAPASPARAVAAPAAVAPAAPLLMRAQGSPGIAAAVPRPGTGAQAAGPCAALRPLGQ